MQKLGYGYGLVIGVAVVGISLGKIIGNITQYQAQTELRIAETQQDLVSELIVKTLTIRSHPQQLLATLNDSIWFKYETSKFINDVNQINHILEQLEQIEKSELLFSYTNDQELRHLTQDYAATTALYAKFMVNLWAKVEPNSLYPSTSKKSAQYVLQALTEHDAIKLRIRFERLSERLGRLEQITTQQRDHAHQKFDRANVFRLRVVGISMFLSTAIAIILAYVTSRAISRPIETLTLITEQAIQDSNFELCAPITTHDEVGKLASAFNQFANAIKSLLEQQKSTRQELERHNLELENKVTERTQILLEQNKHINCLLEENQASQKVLESYNITLEEKVNERTQELSEINNHLNHLIRELEKATRLKDEFLANMSHELRTPLNAVLGMSEALQMRLLGDLNDRQAKAIATVERSGRHLLELINDILDLSKVEAGKIELQLEAIAIEELCETSLSFVRQAAMLKQITLSHRIRLPSVSLQADPRRLRQILINLLSNAVKFTPHGGSITMEVGPSDLSIDGAAESGVEMAWLKFAIADTGIGIAPEHLKQLFQPFMQIDSRLNRQYEGTGLGLALVRRLAELHGGKVRVESEVGCGSCFSVYLPLQTMTIVSSAVQNNGEPSEDVASDQFSPRVCADDHDELQPSWVERSPLILVAEDNPSNVEIMQVYLESLNYSYLVASDGNIAFEMTAKHRPDLILMDIQMPNLDGLAAIRQIRDQSYGATIPIVALTALAMDGDRQLCLEAGADAYLAKPISLQSLAQMIHTHLHKSPSETS